MKKILISVGMMLALTGSAYASGETVTIPVEDYKAIINKLNALQQRVEVLESTRQQPIKPADVQMDRITRDIDHIYDSLDDLESRAQLLIFK